MLGRMGNIFLPFAKMTLLQKNIADGLRLPSAIKRNINDNWGFYITVEGCEIIKNHIKKLYDFLFRGDA